MTSSPTSDSPDPLADLLARFRQAHPQGDVEALRASAAGQPELAGDPERIEAIVARFEEPSRGGSLLHGLLPSGHASDSLRLFGRWDGAERGSDAAGPVPVPGLLADAEALAQLARRVSAHDGGLV